MVISPRAARWTPPVTGSSARAITLEVGLSREELETVRPLRRSPLYDRLAAKRAVFGSKMNWERANYFLPPGAVKPPYTLGTPGWLPQVLEEQRACREDVVVFDPASLLVLHARRSETRRHTSPIEITLECGCSCRV